tara:strand:+ start:273 stop:476 length:204 start_codon:yes stop_codon:yes gene_type:complete
MGRVKQMLIEQMERDEKDFCPTCEGTGVEMVEVFKPQSFYRDVGEPYEEARRCETCDGSGQVDWEEE